MKENSARQTYSEPDKKEGNARIIVFFGPEGCGKTTQAQLLSQKLNLPYVGIGNIARELATSDFTELGDAIRDVFNNSTYLASDLLNKMIAKRVALEDTSNGFILDGGLRTAEETKTFNSLLYEVDRNLPVTVIHINIPGWRCALRLKHQRKRVDDTAESIIRRMRGYYYNLDERLKIAKENWNLLIIHANKDTPIKLHKKIIGLLEPDN